MRRSSTRSRRGFTAQELLVGMSLSLVIGALGVGLTRWAVISVTHAEDRLDTREHIHLACATMREVLGTAWAYRTDPGASRVTFAGPSMRGDIVLDPSTGSLSLRPEGQAVRTLIPSGVRSFQAVSEYSGLIRIMIELGRPARESGPDLGGTVAFVEEIYLPTIGERGQGIPWNATVSLEDPQALVPSI